MEQQKYLRRNYSKNSGGKTEQDWISTTEVLLKSAYTKLDAALKEAETTALA